MFKIITETATWQGKVVNHFASLVTVTGAMADWRNGSSEAAAKRNLRVALRAQARKAHKRGLRLRDVMMEAVSKRSK